MRKKALRLLAVFCAVMLLFTVLSRAVNAMTIPRVQTAAAEKRSIEHIIRAEGTVEALSEQPIYALEGLKIEAVLVAKGQKVTKGQILAQINQTSLQEKIKELEQEIGTVNLEIADAQHNRSVQSQTRERNLNQATEDYNNAAASQDAAVNNAWQEMANAQSALEAFYAEPPASEAGEEGTEGAEAAAKAQEERAAQGQQLQAEYEAKKSAYDQAVTARDEMLNEKNKAIRDAQAPAEKSSTVESAALKKQGLEEKLGKYNELLAQSGKITAPADGVITSLDTAAVTGGVAPATSLMLIAGGDAGMKFVTNITKEQQKYVSLGDEVTLVTKENKEINGSTVTSITKNEKNEGTFDVTVAAAAGQGLQVYDSATMKVAGSSNTYTTCVPKSALHKDSGNQDYVLLLVEKDTILGKQLELEQKGVTVLDSNDKYAALMDGDLTQGQKVVQSSDREIEAGDKVRLAENNE